MVSGNKNIEPDKMKKKFIWSATETFRPMQAALYICQASNITNKLK